MGYVGYEIGLTHTIDAAHRVVGHEGGKGKCARLHGHTYRFDVKVGAHVLDETGFVIDFARIKDALNEWDHRTLLWEEDPLNVHEYEDDVGYAHDGIVRLPFNPTAENLARAAAQRIFNALPEATRRVGAYVEVVCHETPKSTARFRVGRL